jgi:hypothetical protein
MRRADEALARERLVHQAQHGTRAVVQRDQCAPQRQAEHERLGAVDGIEHPREAGGACVPALFLAEDAVPRIADAARRRITAYYLEPAPG